jgi:hypothetical protein
VKKLLFRADRMSLVYRYLLEEGKLDLISQIAVESKLIPIEQLMWKRSPFDFSIIALSDFYPADMEDVFVKVLIEKCSFEFVCLLNKTKTQEMGVPERLKGAKALSLWKSEAKIGKPKKEWIPRALFLLECIADSLHLIKQDEINDLLLLNAQSVIHNNICLKTNSVLLYQRLVNCEQLAFVPSASSASARTRLLKLYDRRSNLIEVTQKEKIYNFFCLFFFEIGFERGSVCFGERAERASARILERRVCFASV